MYMAAGDARRLPLSNSSVDLVVTSPPYWQKRDYGFPQQIGRERTVEEYVASLLSVLSELRRVLTASGSVFLNIGDTYVDGSLAGVPSHLEIAARRAGWLIPNRIVWAKPSGMPSPHRTRLVARHEAIFHLTPNADYFYDLDGYLQSMDDRVDSGDVWTIPLRPNKTRHLAPFPPEIAERAIHLACPRRACVRCGRPERRRVEATAELNPARPQARRAMELARERGITDDHIRAIRATGICDAGKAQQWQTGAGKNTDLIQVLAAEAKEKLGGYFREFTFPLRKTVGFQPSCRCRQGMRRGIVLDPFAGTGTSLQVAASMKRIGIGFDYEVEHLQLAEAQAVGAEAIPGNAGHAAA
ncbi:MAG TPA: site-specific DNA-methyltransferase [Longimicrobium sp.]|jgi:DNA modification methylase|uniref:DNA-methyltransferase n=1 Tax=Longimicrobium sp. TaxID=2029185 RepID=UPI002ED77A0F